MSLLPLLFDDSHCFLRPSRSLNQHFAGLSMEPEEYLLNSMAPLSSNPNFYLQFPASVLRNLKNITTDLDPVMSQDKDSFIANVDVQQFRPDEISVKIADKNMLTIEGKHEEKQDEHGFISRHFVRKFLLPQDCDINKIQSKLSSDGVLCITAPKIDKQVIEQGKDIPIMQTGAPAKQIEKKMEAEADQKDVNVNQQQQ